MKVTAIVQARMGSARLSGKVLFTVKNKPLLLYEIERLQKSKNIKNIIIATSELPIDDPIEDFCRYHDVLIFRGSETDVLDRYYKAASQYQAKHIMRITGDCPLIEPDVCDLIVEEYFSNNVDYVRTGQSFAEGLDCEVVSFAALEKSWKEAELSSEREHVTLYINNHSELFSFFIMENDIDDSWIRITVDNSEDFEVIRHIIKKLQENELTLENIRLFLLNNPEILQINSNIIRNEGLLKSLNQDKKVTTNS
jgi:spore coat polysaccharide biosynthesis protein SpsF